jgi:lysophospholipase L1-like esterase
MNNQIVIASLLISSSFNLVFLLVASVLISKRGGFSFVVYKILQIVKSKMNQGNMNYPPYYQHKKSQFEKLPKSNSDIIFLGDSITDEGEWAELLGNPHVKNRGISGDTTSMLQHRLETILESKPKQIFLMIGINDLVHEQKSPEAIVAGYKQILQQFQAKILTTQVFVQSVLPVNNNITRYWQNPQNILKLNTYLQELAEEFNYQYIDVFSHLSNSQNQLDVKYTSDGLHLNGAAYLVWRSVIAKYVGNLEVANNL